MKPAQCNLGHRYAERIEGNKGEGYFLLKINLSIESKKTVLLYRVSIKRKKENTSSSSIILSKDSKPLFNKNWP